MTLHPDQIEVIAPNLKRRLSGVTATIVRLVPLQARDIGIVATGPGLPDHVPHLPLWRCLFLSRDRLRVWHARRNVEMILGLLLRGVFRRRLAIVFTSASQRKHSRLTRWLIRRMDGSVATSDRTAAYLERPPEVILHGIDTADFAPAPDQPSLRAKLGLPTDAVIMGCYGRIRAQKGTDVFVDAALKLLPDRPQVIAVVMGKATEGHDAFLTGLQQRVRDKGLSERILFLPEVPVHQMADWYAALDLYVAPQRWEGFGLTPLEAMACGVPVVATRVGAFEQIVAEGETGTLVAPGNIGAMVATLAPWLDDAQLRQTAGKAAQSRVASSFKIEGEAAKLIAVYRRLLAGKRW